MKMNMGMIDRLLRVALAIGVGILYYMGVINGLWAAILLAIACVFILTSLVGFCPLYLPFGIRTIRRKN